MSLLHFTRAARLRVFGTLPRLTRTCQSTRSSKFFQPPHSPSLNLSRHNQGSFIRRTFSSGYGYSWSSNAGPNQNVLYGAIGINCGIYCTYLYLDQQKQQGYVTNYAKFVNNFTLNLTRFKEGYYWTTLTSCFSHVNFMHLLSNMVSFYFMGKLLVNASVINPARFITIIIGSGLAGSLGYLANREQKNNNRWGIDQQRALGFSGCVMGVGTVAACMFPRTTFLIYGIVPMPLWALMGGYFLYDGYYVSSDHSRTAHAGHLGGLVFGLGYYLLVLRSGRGLRLR